MTRIQKLSEMIKAAGLDALMLARPSRINRSYLYGFSSSGGIFIVGSSGESTLIIDRRYIEKAEQEAPAQGYNVIVAETFGDYDRLADEVCRERGYKRVGFEDHLTPVSALQALKAGFSCELVPAGQMVEALRISKSAEEADRVRAAQLIAEKSFEEILPFIRAGRTEIEVARELTIRLFANGGEALSFRTFCLSGPNSSRPHGENTHRIIERGDFVMLDFGVLLNGYYSDMTRTVAVGHATDEMKRVYDAVLNAQLRGLEAAAPGKTCHEVDNAARSYIEGLGFAKSGFAHLLGHGLGMTVSEAPMVDVGVNEVLPVGATFTVEPGIYLPGKFGVRIEDMVWLGPDGLRNLTSTPKELLVL